MTETPIPRLVLTLAPPRLACFRYEPVQHGGHVFCGDPGERASGAVGIVFALMAIIQAFGFMFGHGAGSNISRLLGARQVELPVSIRL